MASIREAPALAQPMMAANPTAPQPRTAVVLPGCTPAGGEKNR